MRNWTEPEDISVSDDLQNAVGGHPLVAKILVRRGLTDVLSVGAFLDPTRFSPVDPVDFPGMLEAVSRVERAIERRENICVWGDFDVDGQTATALLFSAIKDLGADITYHIPVRATESHGVNLPVLKKIIAQGARLVITCDTGISSNEPIAYGQENMVDIIVTDHHELPATLPSAFSIVTSQMLQQDHPSRTLPGVGVAFKLVEALYRHAGISDRTQSFLDLTALGIVADLAILTGETRYLLQLGLNHLRNPERLGIRSMMDLAGVDPSTVTEEQISFVLAPRLNALGRLDDANAAVTLLTTSDLNQAHAISERLERLNTERRLLTDQVFEGAMSQINQNPKLLDDATLVLAHPSWPAGVLGIVASRLAQRYGKPAILLSSPVNELARGSARSVDGIDITAALSAQKERLADFGGHPMAAGLSIESSFIPELRRTLSRTVQQMQAVSKPTDTLDIDAYIEMNDISIDLAVELERLSPFGPGNPAPVLVCSAVSVKSVSTVGRTGEHLQVLVEDSKGNTQRVLWWQGAGWPLPEGRFDLAFSARVNFFRGKRTLQLEWLDSRPVEELPAARIRAVSPQIHIVDYRRESLPLNILKGLAESGNLQVWCEGPDRKIVGGQTRLELSPSEEFAIWTIPPGPREFQNAIERVHAETLYLFANDPGLDEMDRFLRYLLGLAKHCLISKKGQATISELAAAMSHRDASVRLGLEWLNENGHLALRDAEGGLVLLAEGTGKPNIKDTDVSVQLKSILHETKAYRSYFVRCDEGSLISLVD